MDDFSPRVVHHPAPAAKPGGSFHGSSSLISLCSVFQVHAVFNNGVTPQGLEDNQDQQQLPMTFEGLLKFMGQQLQKNIIHS